MGKKRRMGGVLAVGAIAATTSVTAVAAQEVSPPPLPAQCPQTICVYGYDATQFFTGPNQLGPNTAGYQLNYQWSQGVASPGWPALWSAQGNTDYSCPNQSGQWCSAFPASSKPSEVPATTAVYVPPAQLPAWDVFSSSAGGESPFRMGAVYTRVGTQPDQNRSQFVLMNSPVTFEINNELGAGNDLVLDGQLAATPALILDPVGTTSGTSVPAGSSYYVGAYQPAVPDGPPNPVDNMSVGQAALSFTLNGAVGSPLAGSSFIASVVVDPVAGLTSQSCAFLPGSSSQSIAKCAVSTNKANPLTVTFDLTAASGGSQ